MDGINPTTPDPVDEPTPFVPTQQFVDRIVARAQNSHTGLGEPKAKYDLSIYGDEPNLESVALLLVNVHLDKYDLVSLFAAGMEEIEEQRATLERRAIRAEKERDAAKAQVEERGEMVLKWKRRHDDQLSTVQNLDRTRKQLNGEVAALKTERDALQSQLREARGVIRNLLDARPGRDEYNIARDDARIWLSTQPDKETK